MNIYLGVSEAVIADRGLNGPCIVKSIDLATCRDLHVHRRIRTRHKALNVRQ